MSAIRGRIDRFVARISLDRILPWSDGAENSEFYESKARKAGF